MSTGTQPRAGCPVCKRDVVVGKSGRMRMHPQKLRVSDRYCAGSGKKAPMPAEAQAR